MARNTAETVFTGDAAGLVAAYQQVREENRKREQELRDLKATAREAHQEELKGLREAQQMYREVQTPLEKYRDRVKDIERAYESGAIDQDTYNRQLAHQKALLDQTTASTGLAATAVKSLTSAFMGFVGVTAILAAVRTEFEALRKLADDARLTNLDFAGVMKGTRNAFAADATLNDEQLEGRLIAAGKEARTSPKVFAAAMQDVFSAKGTASNEEAVQAAIAAFRLNPGDLESGRTLAARALDVRQATGSTDFMANIGFLQNVQANSRVTDLATVGKHFTPAISGIMTRGDTAEQAAELVASLNTLMADAEGAITKTATISLSGQLKDFQPKNRQARARFAGAGSTTERLAMLQGDSALAQEFLANASFEQQATPFIEKLVTGSADALAVQADKAAKIRPLDAAQGAELEKAITAKEASDRAKLLALEEERAVGADVAQLQNMDRAREGQVRAIVEGAFTGTNMRGAIDAIPEFIGRRDLDTRIAFGQDPAAAGIDVLNKRLGAASFSTEDRQFFEQQIALLQRMADGLDKLPGNAPPEAAQSR